MPTVRHRTNPTRLKSIDRNKFEIEMIRDSRAHKSSFSLQRADFQDLDLPADANAFLVAYSDTREQRVSLGSVGSPKLPKNISLAGFDGSKTIRFRVFVRRAQEHRLLATCEGIIANGEGDDPQDLTSLLPVEYDDLGELLWRLDGSYDQRPTLMLNDVHPIDIRSKIDSHDALFRALIVPQAVEQALFLFALYFSGEEQSDHWQEKWKRAVLHFGCAVPDILSDELDVMEIDNALKWARETAKCFAQRMRLGGLLENQISREGN